MDSEPSLTLEALRAEAQERISRLFAEALPAAAQEVIQLAVSAKTPAAVKLKAATRILDEFSPTAKQPHLPSTTVQILNQIPMPEYRALNGKATDTVTIAGARVSLPDLPKPREIGPGNPMDGRKRYEGEKLYPSDSVKPAPDPVATVPGIKPLPPKI